MGGLSHKLSEVGEEKAELKGFLTALKPSLPHGPILPVPFVRSALMP